MRYGFISYVVLVLALGLSAGESAPKKEAAAVHMNDVKKQVAEHVDVFRKTRDLADLRKAADLIESIDVHGVSAYDERQSVRKTKLILWMAVLDAIDSSKDPAFNPDDVPAARVLVPSDTPMKPGVPIVTPEGIADPKARRKYDEAVAANADKTQRYRFQKELRQLDSQLTPRAETYIRSAYLKSPRSENEVEEAIEQQLHTPDRAARVRAIVTR